MSKRRMIVCKRCRIAMMPGSGKFCRQCLDDKEKACLIQRPGARKAGGAGVCKYL